MILIFSPIYSTQVTDPFTGKAFAFKKEGKKITITAVVPEGEKPSANNNFTYELELED